MAVPSPRSPCRPHGHQESRCLRALSVRTPGWGGARRPRVTRRNQDVSPVPDLFIIFSDGNKAQCRLVTQNAAVSRRPRDRPREHGGPGAGGQRAVGAAQRVACSTSSCVPEPDWPGPDATVADGAGAGPGLVCAPRGWDQRGSAQRTEKQDNLSTAAAARPSR